MATVTTPTRSQPRSVGLWVFACWKGLGVFWTLAYVVFTVVWTLPAAASAGYAPDVLLELAVHGTEAALTIVGIVLIFLGHRRARAWWIGLLIMYCFIRLAEVFLSEEPIGAGLLLITGLGWLAYWVYAPAPRQLALGTFWNYPGSGRPG